jgi:hypothetical protein
MTAITINLLVEEHLAKEAAARDPFKIAVAVGVGLLAVLVVIGALVGGMASRKHSEVDRLQKKLAAMTDTQLEVGADGGDTKSLKALADDYVAIHQARPLYAPHLATIKDLVPETIHLTQIGMTLVMDAGEAMPVDPPKEGEKPKRPKAKPTERLVIQLSGQATAPRPELEVDELINSFSKHPTLSSHIHSARLRSIARAPTGGETKQAGVVPSVVFAAEVEMKGGLK